jgi:hypothetical protein
MNPVRVQHGDLVSLARTRIKESPATMQLYLLGRQVVRIEVYTSVAASSYSVGIVVVPWLVFPLLMTPRLLLKMQSVCGRPGEDNIRTTHFRDTTRAWC